MTPEEIEALRDRVDLLERRLAHVLSEHMTNALLGCADPYCVTLVRGY